MTDFSSPSQASTETIESIGVTDGDGVIDALGRQVVLYEQIESLARQQSEFVQTGQAEQLLSLLAQRQRLIAGLTTINDQLEPARREWATFVGTLTGSQKQAIASLTRRIDVLRQGILEQDDRDRIALSAARDNVGHDLRKLSQTGQAARAYQSGRMVGSESTVAAAVVAANRNESMPRQLGEPTVIPVQSRLTDRKG